MLKINHLLYIGLAFVLISCVTINIYFPAAAAEEAARVIVRDVLDKQPTDLKPEGQQGSRQPMPYGLVFMDRLLARMIPAAHAEQADITIDSPAIRRLSNSMNQRHDTMRTYFVSGALGFGNHGLVLMRNANAIPLRERNRAKKLITDENDERNALYREIARANGHPEWEDQVRSTFARVWVDEAPKGYWYQDAGGAWQQR